MYTYLGPVRGCFWHPRGWTYFFLYIIIKYHQYQTILIIHVNLSRMTGLSSENVCFDSYHWWWYPFLTRLMMHDITFIQYEFDSNYCHYCCHVQCYYCHRSFHYCSYDKLSAITQPLGLVTLWWYWCTVLGLVFKHQLMAEFKSLVGWWL